MNILLYEYISGGGLAGKPIPINLLSEGYAMLRGLTADFKSAGHAITVLLDSRLDALKPLLNADNVMQVSSDINSALVEASQGVEAALAIAPESNHILQSIVKRIETLGLISLNCQPNTIEAIVDKSTLAERARCLGLNTPETVLLKTGDATEISPASFSKLGFPVIVKPVNGAGCSNLSIAKNKQQVITAIKKIKSEASGTPILIQKLIEGTPASVSLISTGTRAVPVSLNRQDIILSPPDSESSYNGGMVPLDSPLKDKAFSAAKRIVESFSGLRGYVGVDLILKDGVFVIEINPRLTTSYVGLRKVTNYNPAQAILNAVLKKELPNNPQCKGYACFSKVPITSSLPPSYEKICKIPEVISPPISFNNADIVHALVESYADTSDEALAGFSEAKKRLLHTYAGGK